MKLGICYNIFDGEELLESSIRSVRAEAAFVVVVYQTRSNFGELKPRRGSLARLMDVLARRGLIDEAVCYEPVRSFDDAARRELVCPQYSGASELVGAQFLNEAAKRELGRRRCVAAGCSHFMSMDCDEFYRGAELRAAKAMVEAAGDACVASACRMRLYVRGAHHELRPPDELNSVTMMCRADAPIRLGAARYPVLVDPTRRVAIEDASQCLVLPRAVVEMHHMSLVRADIGAKLRNASNRANLDDDVDAFAERFERWTPADGVLHPHPVLRQLFDSIDTRADPFRVCIDLRCLFCQASAKLRENVGVTNMDVPSKKNVDVTNVNTMRFCSKTCQLLWWSGEKRGGGERSGERGGRGEWS
jgi:hypothetical protein